MLRAGTAVPIFDFSWMQLILDLFPSETLECMCVYIHMYTCLFKPLSLQQYGNNISFFLPVPEKKYDQLYNNFYCEKEPGSIAVI